jgi:hypothetical protein
MFRVTQINGRKKWTFVSPQYNALMVRLMPCLILMPSLSYPLKVLPCIVPTRAYLCICILTVVAVVVVVLLMVMTVPHV